MSAPNGSVNVDKMNPEVKVLWLAALRGGSYKQAAGHLRKTRGPVDNAEGFCCLGVLCDIAVQQGVIPEPTKNAQGVHSYGKPCTCYNAYDHGEVECDATASAGILPSEVGVWAGIYNGGQRGLHRPSLVVLNDRGTTFEEIADIIEAEY